MKTILYGQNFFLIIGEKKSENDLNLGVRKTSLNSLIIDCRVFDLRT